MGAGKDREHLVTERVSWDTKATTKDGPGGAANAVIPVLTPDYTGGSLMIAPPVRACHPGTLP